MKSGENVMTPESLFTLHEWGYIFDAVFVRQIGLQSERKTVTETDREIDDTYSEILAIIKGEMEKLL